MSNRTVRILPTENSIWAMETGDSGERITYISRGAAIVAGVHWAMENDAVLRIHGMDTCVSELDFRDCHVLGSA